MLQPLNPLAQAATKLGRTGPSALDVGYKRLGMEQAADMASAKLASARDKVDAQKQATAQKMNAPLLKATVMQFHQDLWNKDVNDYYDWWANAQAAYSRGEGPDPVASGEAGRRINGLLQKAANSKTLEDNWKAQHEAVAKAKMEQSGAFPENADELIDQEFAKPEYYGSGQVPSYIQGMWDLEGRVKNRVSQLKMSKSGWAGPAADGGAASRHTEAYDQAEVRREAESLATEEGAAKEVQMRYERMDDKTKAEVESLIKQYGMSFTGGMLYYFMKPKTSAVQETSTYTQPGGAGMGFANKKIGAKWLIGVSRGILGGQGGGQTGQEAAIATRWADLPFEQKTEIVRALKIKSEGELVDKEVLTDFNGLTYETTAEKGGGAPLTIRGMLRNPTTNEVNIVYASDAVTKKTASGEETTPGEVRSTGWIPENEYYSRVIRPIAMNNDDFDVNITDKTAQEDFGINTGGGRDIKIPKVGPSAQDRYKQARGGGQETPAERYKRMREGK